MIKVIIATGMVYSKSITNINIKYSIIPNKVATEGILVKRYTSAQTIMHTTAHL